MQVDKLLVQFLLVIALNVADQFQFVWIIGLELMETSANVRGDTNLGTPCWVNHAIRKEPLATFFGRESVFLNEFLDTSRIFPFSANTST